MVFFPNVTVLELGMTRKYNCSTTAVEVVLILQFRSFLTSFFYIAVCWIKGNVFKLDLKKKAHKLLMLWVLVWRSLSSGFYDSSFLLPWETKLGSFFYFSQCSLKILKFSTQQGKCVCFILALSTCVLPHTTVQFPCYLMSCSQKPFRVIVEPSVINSILQW